MSSRRRSSQTVCDSLLCTVAVITPVAISLAYYRNDLRQLLRILFLAVFLFGALLTVRHLSRRGRQWLKKRLSSRKTATQQDNDVVERPDLDREREQLLRKVQRAHDEKADDYERRIAGPRRNKRLEEAERKSRYFRGFGGSDGHIVGGDTGVMSSRLIDQSQQSIGGSHDDESCDDHVTDVDDVINEGDQSGELVWVAVRLLNNRTIRQQFYTSQTMKVVYKWLSSEGYDVDHNILVTLHPRQLINDRGRTLYDYGITVDTRLVLEEIGD